MITPKQELELRKYAREKGYSQEKIDSFIREKKSERFDSLFTAPKTQEKKGDGFLKSVIKDPVKTLIVKPGTRIAQAGIGLYGALSGNERAQDFAGQDIDVDLPGLGKFNIEAQRSGLSGAKQITGDALKTASYLYTPSKAAGAAREGLAAKKLLPAFKQGFKAAAPGGAAFSSGQALIEDKPLSKVAKEGIKGGLATGITGGLLNTGAVATAKGIGKGKQLVTKAKDQYLPGKGVDNIITRRQAELDKLDAYASLRKSAARAQEQGINVKKVISETDLLHNAVDGTGTIRTMHPDGAYQKMQDFIKPQEDVIGKNLQQEGKKIPLKAVEAKLKAAVNESGLKGGAKVRALRNVEDDVAGYALDADKDGYISLSILHEAKIDKTSNINYLNPESKRADKAIAKGLKELVETHSKSVDVKNINKELARHYAVLDYLEKLDGKKVEGGKLGKYFAQTLGGIAGSHFGPLGTIIGSEVAGKIKGLQMSSKFSRKIGQELKPSSAMLKAIERGTGKIIRLP
jgi:hypothetical protein